MTPFVLSQILAGIAICSDLISFQFKEKKHIICCLLVSCIMISLHFMCLGHWTAACLAMVAMARFFTCLFTNSRVVMAGFVAAVLIVSVLTYEGLLSILGCSGAVVGTVASFSKTDKRLRQLMLVCTAIWILHNYLAGSPGAVLMELIFISSNLVGYFRYYIRPARQVLT